MPWTPLGRVFVPPADHPWMKSHAQVPWALVMGDVVRVWFGTRDADNKTWTAWLDLDAADPRRVVRVGEAPALGPGELGGFDDQGAMPSCVLPDPDRPGVLLHYYTGWNTSTSVPYRNSIGLAESTDGGQHFTRCHRGPVVDRTRDEPHFCAMPTVIPAPGAWRMWYLRGVDWQRVGGKAEARYHLRAAVSPDGHRWEGTGVAVDLLGDGIADAALVRPAILPAGDRWHMWFSRRGLHDYRSPGPTAYRLGYAWSADRGQHWVRDDAAVALAPAGDPEAWDSHMIGYPAVFSTGGAHYLLYNGRGFGASGFGLARWDGPLPGEAG